MIYILILVSLLYYFYTKNKLYEYKIAELFYDNKLLDNKVRDLEDYKRDISKTFKILDQDLVVINNHIKSRDNTPSNTPNNPTNITPLNVHLTDTRVVNEELYKDTNITGENNSHNNIKVLDSYLIETLFKQETEEQLAQQFPRPEDSEYDIQKIEN